MGETKAEVSGPVGGIATHLDGPQAFAVQEARDRRTSHAPASLLLKGSTWGRVLLFFVVLISLLELLRQISPLEYTMEVKSEEFYQKYHKYIVLFEKLFGL